MSKHLNLFFVPLFWAETVDKNIKIFEYLLKSPSVADEVPYFMLSMQDSCTHFYIKKKEIFVNDIH